MSHREAVDALKALGLGNYEARVFVALHRLGGGTAQEVSKNSEVPRSQVYGTADDLADRGLVEVVETSPKEYRPVDLDTARSILGERLRQEERRAFENLESIRAERTGPTGGDVSTLRGHQAIDARIAEMTRTAREQVILTFPRGEYLPPEVRRAIEERAAEGVQVTLVSQDSSVREAFAGAVNVAVLADPGGPNGFTGRLLLVDDDSILISVLTEDDDAEPMDEMALWTAETKIARILAQFVHAGVQRVLGDRNGGRQGGSETD